MDAYVGQINVYGFNFAPKSWAFCDGSLLAIKQNSALFSLLGVQFGGDGTVTFALPKLDYSAVCGPGQGAGLSYRYQGDVFGSQTVTLNPGELPQHLHPVNAVLYERGGTRDTVPTSTAGLTTSIPNIYTDGAADVQMYSPGTTPQGGGAAHNNMQPFLALNFSICLSGAYPSFG